MWSFITPTSIFYYQAQELNRELTYKLKYIFLKDISEI